MRSQMSSIPLEHLDVVIKRAKLQSCLLLIARGGMIRAEKSLRGSFPRATEWHSSGSDHRPSGLRVGAPPQAADRLVHHRPTRTEHSLRAATHSERALPRTTALVRALRCTRRSSASAWTSTTHTFPHERAGAASCYLAPR